MLPAWQKSQLVLLKKFEEDFFFSDFTCRLFLLRYYHILSRVCFNKTLASCMFKHK